jgi:ubiquitin-like modifier-activating enzyme ATG7
VSALRLLVILNTIQSLTDRTLDQQCTVTRPGVAAIASALLVEILVSILQHPAGAVAPAPGSHTEDRGDHPLGIVPHQIRGFLSSFQNMVIRGRSYDCCSACSDRVVDAYRQDAWGFLKRALNEKGYVEELSGLAEVGLCRPEHTERYRELMRRDRYSAQLRRQTLV